jgi:hypothetical protein
VASTAKYVIATLVLFDWNIASWTWLGILQPNTSERYEKVWLKDINRRHLPSLPKTGRIQR